MGVELPSLEAIKRFVQMGNGVALVPGLTVRPELESGALVRVQVPELQIERKLRLVYRRQASLSHAALAFLKVVEAYAAAHGDPYCFLAERGMKRAGINDLDLTIWAKSFRQRSLCKKSASVA